jgi:hypothetical protein
LGGIAVMERAKFQRRLEEATERVVTFSRKFVINALPSECRYLVYPNQSYDGHPRVGDEQTFPEEELPEGEYLGPFDASQVIEYLWRDGKVPEWVNVTVCAQDDEYTYLEVLCCGRFTANDGYLYHEEEGCPPFHVLGPAVPWDWESVERDGKFDLYWNGPKPKGL